MTMKLGFGVLKELALMSLILGNYTNQNDGSLMVPRLTHLPGPSLHLLTLEHENKLSRICLTWSRSDFQALS